MTKKLEKQLTEIAIRNLLVEETLESRRSDNLDFHDCAVWCIKQALKEAYELGLKEGRVNSKSKEHPELKKNDLIYAYSTK